MEKRILRLHKSGTGILKIGEALGIGTGTVQRVLMEQPRPFDVGVAEAVCLSVKRRRPPVCAFYDRSGEPLEGGNNYCGY